MRDVTGHCVAVAMENTSEVTGISAALRNDDMHGQCASHQDDEEEVHQHESTDRNENTNVHGISVVNDVGCENNQNGEEDASSVGSYILASSLSSFGSTAEHEPSQSARFRTDTDDEEDEGHGGNEYRHAYNEDRDQHRHDHDQSYPDEDSISDNEDYRAAQLGPMFQKHGNAITYALAERVACIESIKWFGHHIPECVVAFLIDEIEVEEAERQQLQQEHHHEHDVSSNGVDDSAVADADAGTDNDSMANPLHNHTNHDSDDEVDGNDELYRHPQGQYESYFETNQEGFVVDDNDDYDSNHHHHHNQEGGCAIGDDGDGDSLNVAGCGAYGDSNGVDQDADNSSMEAPRGYHSHLNQYPDGDSEVVYDDNEVFVPTRRHSSFEGLLLVGADDEGEEPPRRRASMPIFVRRMEGLGHDNDDDDDDDERKDAAAQNTDGYPESSQPRDQHQTAGYMDYHDGDGDGNGNDWDDGDAAGIPVADGYDQHTGNRAGQSRHRQDFSQPLSEAVTDDTTPPSLDDQSETNPQTFMSGNRNDNDVASVQGSLVQESNLGLEDDRSQHHVAFVSGGERSSIRRTLSASVDLSKLTSDLHKSSSNFHSSRSDSEKLYMTEPMSASRHDCALLFVDISGFTKLSTLLDVEPLKQVRQTQPVSTFHDNDGLSFWQ